VIIVAIDPGGTTGLAVWNSLTNSHPILTQFEFSQLTGDHHHDLWVFLLQWSARAEQFRTPFHVVYERFEFQKEKQREGLNYDAKEYIGIVKLFRAKYGPAVHLHDQSRGQKTFWSDEKIKTLGLWQNGRRHAMDALNHLLYYVSFNLKDDSFLRMLK
jgi:hypothetical protein